MKSKSFIFLFVLIFMIVFSVSAVSADDLQTDGQVSGDVDVATVSPWDTTGNLTYEIPAEAKEIKSADVYVNVYAGSAKNTYGAKANVSLKIGDNENQIASEELWIENGTADGTVYPVNNHTDKCYSDYQMHYDITNSLKGLNGSSIILKVDTFKMEDKEFDGRIKLIALVLAYDDGDDDEISYWVDSTQKWTKNNVTTTFNTESITYINKKADLINVALSSANGNFTLNDEQLGDPDEYKKGSYYQYSYWDVSDKVKSGEKTELISINPGTGTYASLKNVLTVLKVEELIADVSLNTEYTSVKTAYAGTNNTLTITVNANKAGKYVVELLADGTIVNSTEVELDGTDAASVLLTDPTVRPVDESTVNGADNAKVVYEVNVKSGNDTVGNGNLTVPVLYNGNLGKDYAFNATGFEDFVSVKVTGDIVIDVKDVGTYLGASAMNRTDVWAINLTEDSSFAGAYIYVPYNWFNAKKYNETEDMFNVTFNGASLAPVAWYRDQGNLGNYGNYGYGVFVYDVSDLIANGDNTLALDKVNPTPAVYPSALIYMYNTTGSTIAKNIAIINGADLLANSNNNAGRTVKADSAINAQASDIIDATLYVLAASAQKGEGNIVFNGVEFADVWNGTSSTTDLFTADVTDSVADANNVSFVATGSTILALPQIIVTSEAIPIAVSVDKIATEYTSVMTAYAGTNNTLTVTLTSNQAANVTVELLADGVVVDSAEVELDTASASSVLLTDPTVRPIDESTANGANNAKVVYEVNVKSGNDTVGNGNLTVPVLYNGYLGADLEFNADGYDPDLILHDEFSGDLVIDIKDAGTYLGASAMNRTDVWTIDLDESCGIVDAYLFVPYNWFNAKTYNETKDMFELTFNGEEILPINLFRDQGNLGNYGKYGYGILVYRVDNLIDIHGNNTLVLNKVNPTPAVYPSALVYWYNAPGGSFKEISIAFGADLLSNDYNKAGRTVKADTVIDADVDDVENATIYILAASAQKGESNIIFNGVEFTDVWNGTSSTTELFTADITDVVADLNNVSFVATGSTILALPQIIVVDTGVALSVDSIKTEYTSVPTLYAGTNNTLTVTVSTTKAGEYEIYLFDGIKEVNKVNVNLTNGTNTILLTDPTIRPIDETTENGANNTKVTYNVLVIYGDYDYFAADYVKLPVLYNGNLGKDYEFNATGFEDFVSVKVTGDIVIDIKDVASYLGASAMNRTDVWAVNLTDDSTIVGAYVYVPYNWFNGKTYNETEDMFDLTFNGESIFPVAWYRDQGNLGNYGKYGYGVLVYDVSDLIANGDNTLDLVKVNPTPAVYPSALIYMYDTAGSTIAKNIAIINGADLLSNSNNNAGRTVKADSTINAETSDIIDATLYVLAAGAQKGESNIIFNGVEFTDVWSGTSSTTDLFTANVTDTVADINNISFVATGSTILALPQIIVTSEAIPPLAVSVDKIATEYTSVMTAYAGTNNTLTVTLTSNQAAEVTVELLADGVVVDSADVELAAGDNSVLLTDPTVRPVDETTVNGANNTKVVYSVNVKSGNATVADGNLTVPVLYNGNLGKDYAYDEIGFEEFINVKVTGDIVIDVQDVASYLGAAAMNRTDVWAVNLTDDSSFAGAYIYVPYNWFNGKTYNETSFMFNLTFNGESIFPVGWYRDQGNLGNYGKYGYGVLVYDVSDLIANGNNTLTLDKVNPTPAVYPSALIYMYNTTESPVIKNIVIVNGADLLANSNNKAGRVVKADSIINAQTSDDAEVTLYVLAAGAQKGEGNVVFNGVEFADVWNGTSSTTDLFTADVTNIVKDSNDISFVATGSTILALPQIIVTSEVNLLDAGLKVNVSDAKCGENASVDISFDANITDDVVVLVAGQKYIVPVKDGKGQLNISDLTTGTYAVQVVFAGNDKYSPAMNSTTFSVARLDTIITVDAKFSRVANDYSAGERGDFFYAVLTDINGNPLVNKTVQIAVNGPIYNVTTDEQGRAGLQVNLAAANTYTYALSFQGDDQYKAAPLASSKLTVTKKSTSITAANKAFKAKATKTISVTLKTVKNPYDKKTYLKSGKKITLKINGKTYTAKTNSKGVAKFTIKLTKKGKYTAKIKFAGDKTYKASSKSIKVTIK